jgi:(p)ppGpp synthase/HD superfamily hydrolase
VTKMLFSDSELVRKAALFARRAHEGQLRRNSGLPYIVHPERVAKRAQELEGATEELVAAAWLHDVVEDGGIGLPAIRQEFGSAVAELVSWLTNIPQGPGESRASWKKRICVRLAAAPREAKRLKMLDRIDNLWDADPDPKHEKAHAARRLYASESRDLEAAIGDADRALAVELLGAIIDLETRLPAERKS